MDSNDKALYQARMDKCTTEQFWVVVLLGSMNAFIIVQREVLRQAIGVPALVFVVACATIYGVAFVISRHIIYRQYDVVLSPHLDEISKRAGTNREFRAKRFAVRLTGVFFYALVVFTAGVASTMVLLS